MTISNTVNRSSLQNDIPTEYEVVSQSPPQSDPVISGTVSPLFAGIKGPLSPEELFFGYASGFFNDSSLDPSIEMSARLSIDFPIMSTIEDNLVSGIRFVSKYYPDMLPLILQRETATGSQFIFTFYSELEKFSTSGDATPLVGLLTRFQDEIQGSLSKSENPILEQSYFVVKTAVELLRTQRLDLFKLTPLSLFRKMVQLTPEERHRAAIKACYHIAPAWFNFRDSILGYGGDRATIDKISAGSTTDRLTLGLESQYIKQRLSDIVVIYRSVAGGFESKSSSMIRVLGCFVNNQFRDDFKVVSSPEVDQIIARPGININKTGHYNRNYVQENLEVYQNFIPRFVEVRDWMLSEFQELLVASTTIKYLRLYLRLGDFKNLQKRVDARPASVRFRDIFLEEVKLFAQQCKADRQMQLAIVKVLRESPRLKVIYADQDRFEKVYSHHVAMINIHFKDCLATAERMSGYLFQLPPGKRSSGNAAKDLRPKTKVTSKTEDLKAQVTTDSIPELAAPVVTQTQVASKQQVALEVQLQNLKQKMHDSLKHLQANPKGFGTGEALKNSQVHWEGLLCTMKLFLDQGEGVSGPRLSSFVMDIVRHGALMMEQELTALDRTSNGIKDQAELSDHVSHDLMHLLYSCQVKSSSLSQELRRWIFQCNRGEILLRNLRDAAIDGRSIEKLLTKARLTAEGSLAFPPSNVISDALSYFKKSCILSIQLQRMIAEVNRRDNASFLKTVDSLQEELLEFCKEIELVISSSAAEKQQTKGPQESPPCDEIKQMAGAIHLMKGVVHSEEIQRGLDNILENLFLQLRMEMQAQQFLEPVKAYQHMSKILFLNQEIAEQYLVNLSDACGVSCSLHEIDHDLTQLITLLEMCEKDFTPREWMFLSDGKRMRCLTRYPFSYPRVYQGKSNTLMAKIEKLIHAAIEMGHHAVFEKGNNIELGFQPAKKGVMGEIDAIKEVVREDVATLANILTKVTEKKLAHLKSETEIK